MTTKLHRLAEKARKDPGFKFTSLYHLMNEELLRGCFKRLRKDAAAGIDKMTKDMSAENLEDNPSKLVGRLHRMAYLPQAVRRKYIAKPGSAKQRPLGIPCLEDKAELRRLSAQTKLIPKGVLKRVPLWYKLVQAGLVRIMESVSEQDFIEDSYGFRPSRSCHQALGALSETVADRPVNHIVEADIKGFFDNVNQEWLLKFLGHRIEDKRIQRMGNASSRPGCRRMGG
jgi:retron-type reverse transcriptase